MEELLSKSKKKNLTQNIRNLERGKIPPQAVDLEEVVLGALMIDKKGLDEVIDILSPEIFYHPAHQEIFSAIFSLFANSQPIDLLSVANQLRKDGKLELVGGDYFLIQLTQKVSSSAHIEYHTRIIQEKFILRKLIEISSDIIDKSYDETSDVFDLLDFSENKLFEITNGTLKRSFDNSQHLVTQAIEKIKALSEKEGMSGVPSGFRDIDTITTGWQDSDLVIVAARPGMGKTAFVLSMAKNISVNHKIPIGVFSLEMSSIQLIMRMISSETGISSEKLRKAKLNNDEWKQLFSRVKALEEAPLFIDDTPALSIFDLRAKCRRLVSQHHVKIIVVDYLQLMTAGNSSSGNREQEISTISRSLKAIAKELSIPIVALSQLSRAVETRSGSKRPMLSDLRESGAIEQDADIVSFIYRPEYYKLETWDDEEGTPCKGQAEFIIAKHRNGALDSVKLRFINEQAKFMDFDPFSFNEFQSQINTNTSLQQDITIDSTINIPTIDPKESFGIEDNIDTDTDDMPF